MEKVTTISSKGQVVIPKEIRELYALKPQTKVVFEPAGEYLLVKPAKMKNITQLKKKLSHFQSDPDFRKNWEKTLKAKLKKWGW